MWEAYPKRKCTEKGQQNWPKQILSAKSKTHIHFSSLQDCHLTIFCQIVCHEGSYDRPGNTTCDTWQVWGLLAPAGVLVLEHHQVFDRLWQVEIEILDHLGWWWLYDLYLFHELLNYRVKFASGSPKIYPHFKWILCDPCHGPSYLCYKYKVNGPRNPSPVPGQRLTVPIAWK